MGQLTSEIRFYYYSFLLPIVADCYQLTSRSNHGELGRQTMGMSIGAQQLPAASFSVDQDSKLTTIFIRRQSTCLTLLQRRNQVLRPAPVPITDQPLPICQQDHPQPQKKRSSKHPQAFVILAMLRLQPPLPPRESAFLHTLLLPIAPTIKEHPQKSQLQTLAGRE